jgi:multiple sugar transport system permease protein
VGLSTYRQFLGGTMLTLDPLRNDAGAMVMKDGQPEYPSLRARTRNNPDRPDLAGMRERFSCSLGGESRTYVLARDVVFMKAVVNTFLFVLVVAPVQAGLALGLALLINQRLRGIKVFRAIYFMPVVMSILVVSLLWRLIHDGQSGLLNNLLGAISFGMIPPVNWLGDPSPALGGNHRHVDLAGGRLS